MNLRSKFQSGFFSEFQSEFQGEFQDDTKYDIEGNREIEDNREWDFSGSAFGVYSHGFHIYPACFLPFFVRRLLSEFTNGESVVLDNFMGSGTTLIEATLLGVRTAIGVDINPFSSFIAKVKLTPINPVLLSNVLLSLKFDYFNIKNRECSLIGEELLREWDILKGFYERISFWFREEALEDLLRLKLCIRRIGNEDIRDFFFLCMSEVIRRVSLARHNEFKLYRDRKKLEGRLSLSVWDEFERVSKRNIDLMSDFWQRVYNGESNNKSVVGSIVVRIIYGDARVRQGIEEGSIDYVISSPPYGDSRTTVAYDQFFKLSWMWLWDVVVEFLERKEGSLGAGKVMIERGNFLGESFSDKSVGRLEKDLLDAMKKNLLGGNILRRDYCVFDYSRVLREQYFRILERDEVRAREVWAYYSDLFDSLLWVYRYLKRGSYYTMVIGNRRVRGEYLRTDLIVSDFAREIGFEVKNIITRNIINKRMPYLNSPSNRKGKISSTISQENIIFLKKG